MPDTASHSAPLARAHHALKEALNRAVTHSELARALETERASITRLLHAPGEDVRPVWALAVQYMAETKMSPDVAAEVDTSEATFRAAVQALPMLRKHTALYLGLHGDGLRAMTCGARPVCTRHVLAVRELQRRFSDARAHAVTYASQHLVSML